MAEVAALAQAALAGCAASVSGLVGVELSAGKTAVETSVAIPEGDLAVIPLGADLAGRDLGALTLSTPLAAIATLARRMLGDTEPDKERELSKDELDAVGKLLGLWGGALDAALREHFAPNLRCKPGVWWRSTEPGKNVFEPGECALASGSLAVPGGVEIPLLLRLPAKLLAARSGGSRRLRRVLLLGIDDESRELLSRVLGAAGLEVESLAGDAPERDEALARSDAIFVGGEPADALDRCRAIRLGNHSWTKPALACLRDPTRQRVLEAIATGASHVLRLPAEEQSVLQALELARQ